MTDATAPSTTAARWQRAVLLFAGGLAAILAAGFGAVQSMIGVWWHTTTYQYCFLVVPIVIWLVHLRWERVRTLVPRAEPLAIVPGIGSGVLLALGILADINLVQHVGLVALIVSLAVLVFGREIARELKFPLFFLFFLVPVGDFLIPQLQVFTGTFSVELLRMTGIPTFIDGTLIETPTGRFEVAEACAGVRFLIANIVVAVLFCHLAFEKGWKWVVFLLIATVVPLIGNGLRAYGIMLIAHMTDNEYAVGVDHLVYGWGFFAVLMMINLGIGMLMKDRHVGDPPPTLPWRDTRPLRAGGTLPALLGAVAMVAAPVAAHARLSTIGAPVSPPSIAEVPLLASGWARIDAPQLDWTPVFPSADATYMTRYTRQAGTVSEAVDVFIALWGHQVPGHEAVNQENVFHDTEDRTWIRLETGRAGVATGTSGLVPVARVERLGGGERGNRLLHIWYWVDGTFTSSPLEAKLLQLRATALGGDPSAAVIALSAVYRAEIEPARAALAHFVEEMVPADEALAALAARARR